MDGEEDALDGVPFGEVEGAPTEEDVVEKVDALEVMDKAVVEMDVGVVGVVENERGKEGEIVPEVIGGAQVYEVACVALARQKMFQQMGVLSWRT